MINRHNKDDANVVWRQSRYLGKPERPSGGSRTRPAITSVRYADNESGLEITGLTILFHSYIGLLKPKLRLMPRLPTGGLEQFAAPRLNFILVMPHISRANLRVGAIPLNWLINYVIIPGILKSEDPVFFHIGVYLNLIINFSEERWKKLLWSIGNIQL